MVVEGLLDDRGQQRRRLPCCATLGRLRHRALGIAAKASDSRSTADLRPHFLDRPAKSRAHRRRSSGPIVSPRRFRSRRTRLKPLDQAAASYPTSSSTLRHGPKRAKLRSIRISAIVRLAKNLGHAARPALTTTYRGIAMNSGMDRTSTRGRKIR